MKYGIIGVFALAVIVAGTMGVGAYAQDGSDSGLSGEIRLGLITPLSGDVAQYGEENPAATNLAVDDFNKYLADKDAGWSIELTIEDSQTLPTAALEKIQSLRAKGISIVLGPWSSASLQNVKGYADSNEMLLFSCCSTSPLIAISGDSVFRMSPDDSNQGTAISKLFDDAGIEVMVPVWREDAWGTGLQDASRLSFESRGGIVDDGLGYNPEVSEFSVEASILADTVQGYVNDHGADKVGVLYVGFGEVLLFMQAASDYEVLGDVRWFGSDANTKESKLVEDSIGLGFVTDTMYTTVQVASGKNDLSQYVDNSLNESIGRIPSTYASSAYDMMWLMGLTIEREQSTDVAVLTAAIPEVAEEYVGALGSSRLNDAGDLAQTNYDVWDIRDGSWTLAGTYFSASDTIALEGAMMKDGLTGEVEVGSILPLTGRLSKHGEENWVASVLATVDFNKYLADKGATWTLSATVEDSQTSPTVALEKLQTLHAKNIKIVLGPETSSNLQNMKGYADSNGILLFSCCSTSPLLAISGDTIFRMAPDDTNQGTALSKIFTEAGIEAVVPVWREDAWGVGLIGSIRDSFAARGGTVADGLGYNPEATDFSAETSLLAEIVQEYVDEYGPDKVAVMYIGFGEGLLFMQSASGQEILHDVRWFGTDGNTRDPTFIDDPIGLEFVTDTSYTTVQVASGKNEISKRVDEALVAELGRVPSTYASSAYDAVWVVGLAIDREQSTDVAVLSQAIPEIAAEHTGALGSTRLNDFGDLAQTNYDVWDIRDGSWTLAGTYFSASDTIALEGAMMKDGLTGEVEVGSILPLTGRLSKHGEENWVASVLATVDFNKYLADKGATWTLSATVEDSQTSPTVALEKLQTLHAKNIKIVLGPETSSNLQNMKGYADSNGILLFSCCSTSPLLAISGDTIFRMAPDDTNQGTALSKIFTEAGIEAVVPVWREDAWGVGLIGSIRDSFAARGGTVADGLGYNPEATDFSAETSLLAEIVQEYVDEYGPDKVAVMYIGFGEGLLFMQSASGQEILHDVRWFGTDGNTRDPTFIDDPIGLEFVTDTSYTTVQVASGKNEISKRVDEALVAELGRVPSTYASSAYDAVWVVGLAIDREQSTDVAVLSQAIPEIAAEHTGALGSTRLNDFGDLAQTNYDVWDIRDGSWTLAGTYFSASDTIALEGVMPDMPDEVVPDTPDETTPPGGCLIATAAYGSELAPQVQLLREIRDNTLLSTDSGTSFMTGFNQFYYSFSPAVADLERENAVFRDAVRVAITPGLYTLNIMTLADQNSDASVIAFGLLAIAAMAGIYVAGPVLTVHAIRKRARRA